MAVLPAGILSHPSGKIGDVVCSKWKGIPYIREFVIPANPNTASQQTERGQFRALVELGKPLLATVIQAFWDSLVTQNSGWAHFIGTNRKLMTAYDDFAPIQMCQGALEGALITSAIYAGANVTFVWDETVTSNGALTDYAACVVYDKVNKVAFTNMLATRDDEGQTVAVGTGRTAGDLNAWLWFRDAAGGWTLQSYSDYHQVTA